MNEIDKAVVFKGPGEVVVEEIGFPSLSENDIQIKNIFTGISIGTERWVLTNQYEPLKDKFPIIPGYQVVGEIYKMGKKVKCLKKGNLVVNGWVGSIKTVPNFTSGWGAHATYSIFDWKGAIRLPEEVNLQEAALSPLAAVAFLGVKMSEVKRGDLVCVIGQGIVGQMAAQLSRLRGAKVIACDPIDQRVELSSTYSADRAINPGSMNLRDIVTKEKSEGANIIIDTSGNTKLIDDFLDILCSKGKICLQACYPGVSINPEVLKTHFQDIYSKHPKRPKFVCPSGWEYEDHKEIIQLLSKRKIRISPLISHCINSDNAPETYRLMLEEPQKILGIVLKWT